jgi:hypothetical protein
VGSKDVDESAARLGQYMCVTVQGAIIRKLAARARDLRLQIRMLWVASCMQFQGAEVLGGGVTVSGQDERATADGGSDD